MGNEDLNTKKLCPSSESRPDPTPAPIQRPLEQRIYEATAESVRIREDMQAKDIDIETKKYDQNDYSCHDESP